MSDTPTTAATVTLDTPISRTGGNVTAVTLRKPAAGELRGVHLGSLLQMDVGALLTVLPRITQPSLTVQEVAAMDPADLLQIGVEVASFLLTKAQRPSTDSLSA